MLSPKNIVKDDADGEDTQKDDNYQTTQKTEHEQAIAELKRQNAELLKTNQKQHEQNLYLRHQISLLRKRNDKINADLNTQQKHTAKLMTQLAVAKVHWKEKVKE